MYEDAGSVVQTTGARIRTLTQQRVAVAHLRLTIRLGGLCSGNALPESLRKPGSSSTVLREHASEAASKRQFQGVFDVSLDCRLPLEVRGRGPSICTSEQMSIPLTLA